jgi:hypothetical protein
MNIMTYIHRRYIPHYLRRLTEKYNIYSSVIKVCSSVERVRVSCSAPYQMAINYKPALVAILLVASLITPSRGTALILNGRNICCTQLPLLSLLRAV